MAYEKSLCNHFKIVCLNSITTLACNAFYAYYLNLNIFIFFLDTVENFIHSCFWHSDNRNFPAFFPIHFGSGKMFFDTYYGRCNNQPYLEYQATHLCHWLSVCNLWVGESYALLKMPKVCYGGILGALLEGERGRQVENAWAWPRHHHHFHFRFHHRPNHQHRHRVNKRAYSSYIRNAIPLWRTLCQHFVRKSLCKTMPNALALGSEVFQLSLSAFLWFPFLFGYMLPFTFSAVNIFESFQIK